MAQLVKKHLQCRRPGFDPWVGTSPGEGKVYPLPVFWPEEFHGLYSPWGCKEWDTTDRLSLSGSHKVEHYGIFHFFKTNIITYKLTESARSMYKHSGQRKLSNVIFKS